MEGDVSRGMGGVEENRTETREGRVEEGENDITGGKMWKTCKVVKNVSRKKGKRKKGRKMEERKG